MKPMTTGEAIAEGAMPVMKATSAKVRLWDANSLYPRKATAVLASKIQITLLGNAWGLRLISRKAKNFSFSAIL